MEKGLKPFFLVGNAGTTNTGTVDPLPELADIASKHGLWYHIDAAYGGFFNLCTEGKKILKGLERSDSIVLDPHKGLFVPYGSGSLLVKDGKLLKRSHFLTADYMQDHTTPEGEYDASEYSPELSRSYRGLRVWLPLKLFGVKAFRENLAEKLQLTEWMHHEKIVKSQKLFLSSTLLNGKFVIRVCILSFRTHQTEVEEAFDIIRNAAKELISEERRT
jgi:aromatic-L-amino-acid decarboxylase